MAYGTVNADVIGTSVAGSNLGAGNASIMKNRIINGAMVIDQRNAGASVTPTSNGTYTLDRWIAFLSVSSKYSVQQNAGSVTPPVGFTNYLGVTSLSSYTVGASEYFGITQRIEGYNVADLGWGTANAKTITVSAWVRSSLTGTFGGSIYNSAGDRAYPFTYTISAANTWQQISVTVAGDTSGTWLTTNGIGLQIMFSLGAGSTYSGTAGVWSSTLYLGATGAVSVVGTSGATFYITGVQLEVGSSATGFEYVNYQTSLANCQRYFQPCGNGASGRGNSATNAEFAITFQVPMRSAPTISFGGFSGSQALIEEFSTAGTITATAATSGISSTTGGYASVTISGGNTGVYAGITRGNMFSASAEL